MNAVNQNHSRLMDAVYRNQRHVYDLTRKYYLLGRDRLIENLDAKAGSSVLEVACGTGRNIILAAERYPEARFFGFDISEEMLKTARTNVDKAGLSSRVTLAQGDATGFDPQAMFGVERFDRIFISYALSMIPPWELAAQEAMRHLAPSGSLHVVDFGQQAALPGWFRSGLHAWLAKFHVEPRAEMEQVLTTLSGATQRPLRFERLYRDYAHYGVIGPVNVV